MEFTVKKANGEGPAPLLAFTPTESENTLDAFQNGSVYKHKHSQTHDAGSGGMYLLNISAVNLLPI